MKKILTYLMIMFVLIIGADAQTYTRNSTSSSSDNTIFDISVTGGTATTKAAIDSVNFGDNYIQLDGSTFYTHPVSTTVRIGALSVANTATGVGNVCIGPQTGASLTNGYENLFVGSQAGQLVTTGKSNVGIGDDALRQANVGADYNVAIGASALRLAIDNNVGIGYYAGRYETGYQKIYIDNLDRTNEANQRLYAPFYAFTNATPLSQVTQIGGGGLVGYTGWTEQAMGTQGKRIEKTANRDVTHSDANWYALYVNGTSTTLVIPASSTWTFTILITGTNDAQSKSFGFEIKGVLERDASDNTTLLGSAVTTLYDTDDTDFNARVSADDATESLLIETTDATSGGDVIRWFATITIAQSTY